MSQSLKIIVKSPVFRGIALTWIFILIFLNCVAIDTQNFWQFFTTAFFSKAKFTVYPAAAVAPIVGILFATYNQYPIQISSEYGKKVIKMIGFALYLAAILIWAFDTSRPNRNVPYPTPLQLVPEIISVMYSNATTFGQKLVNLYMVIISPAVVLYFGTKLTYSRLSLTETRQIVERFLYVILLAAAWFGFEIHGNTKNIFHKFFVEYHFLLVFGTLILVSLLLVLVKFRKEQTLFNSVVKGIVGLILAVFTTKLPQFVDIANIPQSSRYSLVFTLSFAFIVLIACLYYLTYIVAKEP